jgi:hypothetical protein
MIEQDDVELGETGAELEGSTSSVDESEIEKAFKSDIEESKRYRQTFFHSWKRSVETRLGRTTTTDTGGVSIGDDLQSEINPDWSLVKTKTANLFSQVPQVQLTHENEQYAPAIPPFARALNYELGEKRANIGVAIEEVLNDTVNASGVGAVVVGYTALFDEVDAPVQDTLPFPNGPMPVSQIPPEQLDLILKNAKEQGIPIPTRKVNRTRDSKFYCKRISPMDLLWPKSFTGSLFDDADWVGYTDRTSWAEGVNEFGLTPEQKEQVLGSEDNGTQDTLRADSRASGPMDGRKVKYDTIYYWRYRVDPAEKSFKSIWRLVYVHGIDKPVKHEAWKGQQYDEKTGKYIGSCKYPVRVLTLTYISDNAVPPSDSAAGRPQVADLRRSRSQMFKNRERSFPLRWVDSTRVDPMILDLLQRGDIQGFVPTLGEGSRSFGEIARAQYPPEDRSFDQQAKADLMESWQIGQNQNSGAAEPGRKTGTQVTTEQNNFATRIGQERGRVLTFFTSICEVLAGWMVLYSDFPNLSQQERQQMDQVWDSKHILHDLVMKIHPDAAVVMDAQSKIQRLSNFLNMTGKSGYVNPEPIIAEIAELSGLDPAKVMTKPQPHIEEPNISYRFSGKDDMINPMVVAILLAKGHAPTPELIEQAKQLCTLAATPPAPPSVPGVPGQAPGMPVPGGAGGPSIPNPQTVSANEHWQQMPKVAKRAEEVTGGRV